MPYKAFVTLYLTYNFNIKYFYGIITYLCHFQTVTPKDYAFYCTLLSQIEGHIYSKVFADES